MAGPTDAALRRAFQDVLDAVSPAERRAIRADVNRHIPADKRRGVGSPAWRDQLATDAGRLRVASGIVFDSDLQTYAGAPVADQSPTVVTVQTTRRTPRPIGEE